MQTVQCNEMQWISYQLSVSECPDADASTKPEKGGREFLVLNIIASMVETG